MAKISMIFALLCLLIAASSVYGLRMRSAQAVAPEANGSAPKAGTYTYPNGTVIPPEELKKLLASDNTEVIDKRINATAKAQEHVEKAEEHVEKPEEHVEKPEEHTEKAEEHTEKAEEHTEKAEEHTEKAEEHTEKAEEHAEKAEEHTEKTLEKAEEATEKIQQTAPQIIYQSEAPQAQEVQQDQNTIKLPVNLGDSYGMYRFPSDSMFNYGYNPMMNYEINPEMNYGYNSMMNYGFNPMMGNVYRGNGFQQGVRVIPLQRGARIIF